MVRDGDAPPQAPEPPLFESAPPKLSDPSGKDLLGEELALELVQRLLQPNTGNATLQVCRGLWMLTALTEEQTSKKLGRIDEELREDNRKTRARLDERLSVAGAAETAVRTMNEIEIAGFENSCNQQRQAVLGEIAWDFRRLLWIQQQFLTKLKIPGFRGPTVDARELEYQSRICSYLHSAFFLRHRIGESAHTTMMASQERRLIDMRDNPRPVFPNNRTTDNSPGMSPKLVGASPGQNNNNNNGHYPPPPPPMQLGSGVQQPGSAPPPPYSSHLQLPPPPPPPQMPPQPNYLQQQQGYGVQYPPQPPQQQQQHNMMMQSNYSQQQQQQQNPGYYR